jgi:hypothetical protein
MAAGEDQAQPVVVDAVIGRVEHVAVLLEQREGRELRPAHLQAGTAAEQIDGLVTRGAHEPRAGVAGNAGARPARERGRERLLHHVLGEVEVAEEANQGREDASRLLAKDARDRVDGQGPCIGGTGRTSTAP